MLPDRDQADGLLQARPSEAAQEKFALLALLHRAIGYVLADRPALETALVNTIREAASVAETIRSRRAARTDSKGE